MNSTTLADGVVLDLGGGSMQLARVDDRQARDARSWPLGAVRMTERFLAGDARQAQAAQGAARARARRARAARAWLGDAGGGAARRASAARSATSRRRRSSPPSCRRSASRASRSSARRSTSSSSASPPCRPPSAATVPGIKPARGDLILAGAVVVQTVLEVGGFDALEVTEAGPARGRLLRALLDGRDPPLFDDVRRDERAQPRRAVPRRLRATPSTSRGSRSGCSTRSPRRALHPGDPRERELLWAAAMLHDIGMAVDYDDHHKHSRYLILNAGLPGFTPREIALIGQMARYHRKGTPALGGSRRARARRRRRRAARCAALLRLGRAARALAATSRCARRTSRSTTATSSCGSRPTGTSRVARWAAAARGRAVRARVRARAQRQRLSRAIRAGGARLTVIGAPARRIARLSVAQRDGAGSPRAALLEVLLVVSSAGQNVAAGVISVTMRRRCPSSPRPPSSSSAACARVARAGGRRLLLRRGEEDRRAVLGADVGALAVARRRVVGSPEALEQLVVADDGRVEGDLHGLGVAGALAADLAVGGCSVRPPV